MSCSKKYFEYWEYTTGRPMSQKWPYFRCHFLRENVVRRECITWTFQQHRNIANKKYSSWEKNSWDLQKKKNKSFLGIDLGQPWRQFNQCYVNIRGDLPSVGTRLPHHQTPLFSCNQEVTRPDTLSMSLYAWMSFLPRDTKGNISTARWELQFRFTFWYTYQYQPNTQLKQHLNSHNCIIIKYSCEKHH